jgi:uncharacterized ferredoxin-like protein
MIIEKDFKKENLLAIAKRMAAAARTAPKCMGVDNIFISIFEEADNIEVAEHMRNMHSKKGAPDYYLRDAENIASASVMLIIGTEYCATGAPACGACGFKDCGHKEKGFPCAFNTADMGLAVGSAVSIAADHRVDNRILFSVGQAIIDMELLDKDLKFIYGIPLSITSKNPFFDRAD